MLRRDLLKAIGLSFFAPLSVFAGVRKKTKVRIDGADGHSSYIKMTYVKKDDKELKLIAHTIASILYQEVESHYVCVQDWEKVVARGNLSLCPEHNCISFVADIDVSLYEIIKEYVEPAARSMAVYINRNLGGCKRTLTSLKLTESVHPASFVYVAHGISVRVTKWFDLLSGKPRYYIDHSYIIER